MSPRRRDVPDLGVGVGLRVPHYRHIIEERPPVDFFEIISENFMVDGGKPVYHLERVLETYPVIQHGVSLNIAGPDFPDWTYLKRLKRLTEKVRPAWLSDHFCWCGAGGAHLHDLLPVPFSDEAVRIVADRARMVQDYLEVDFALENTSSYLRYKESTMPEWEFVRRVVEEADIGLMFDVNNVYVSAYNHGFDPYEFVRSVPHDRVVQVHLAGHTHLGKYIIDTHRGHVIDPVYDLYRETIALTGPVSTLIEWDDEIPTFDVLMAEAAKARSVRDEGAELFARRRAGKRPPRAPARQPPLATRAEPDSAPRPWKQGGPLERASDAAPDVK